MLTHTEILKEYAACLMDPKYAITSYLRTFDKTQEGFVDYKLFPKQAEIVDAYEKYRHNLVTKPRQAGISTTTQAYMAVKCAFADIENPELIVVVANKLKLAKKFTKGIRDFIMQFPRWVWGSEYYGTKEKEAKSIFVKDSQEELELINGCKIIAVATSEDALRGYAPTYLIFDEAAFIDNGAALYAAAITSISTGGKAILISTPNGYDPLYYNTYDQSIKGENSYNIIEMKWYQDPRYNGYNKFLKTGETDLTWMKKDCEPVIEIEFTDESYKRMVQDGYKPTSVWYRQMCNDMNNDKKKIAQELDVNFLGSGGNVIEDEDIENQKNKYVIDPIFVDKTYFDGNSGLVRIWEEPIEGHQYILSADVAGGSGLDSSAFVIINFTTMEQVCEYQGKTPPDKYAVIINQYGLLYNAYVVVDNIGIGDTTARKLVELKYPNLHYDKTAQNAHTHLNEPDVLDNSSKVAGFNINGVRLQLISNLEIMVRTEGIKIRSMAIIGEMRTFIYKNGKPDHMEGYHDDLLIALGMGLWVLQNSFKKLEKAASQTKAILSAWLIAAGEPTVDNGTFVPKNNRGVAPLPKPNFSSVVSRNMQDPQGQYGWLFSGMK